MATEVCLGPAAPLELLLPAALALALWWEPLAVGAFGCLLAAAGVLLLVSACAVRARDGGLGVLERLAGGREGTERLIVGVEHEGFEWAVG